jgi:large subunit ribosomal protein L9e
MKFHQVTKTVTIPEGCTVSVKARQVEVKGPRGTLKRDFRHQNVEMELSEDKKTITLTKWLGKKNEISALQTFASHIENMITGVTRGYRYKMRFVYAHFPINVTIDGQTVEVRNFLGEKRVRRVKMLGDTKVTQTKTVKDEIVLEGNSVEAVAQSAADIHKSCTVFNKDLRKFLDGIYVSEGGPIPKPV